MNDNQDDLFDDEGSTAKVESEEETQTEDTEESDKGKSEEVTEEQSQGENTEEPPNSEEGKNEEEETVPVSRFKAALKDVNAKLEAANARLAELTAKPPPDRNSDPEGYDLHMRIETSKQIMADLHPDYDETIMHYQTLAKNDPTLNAAVSAAANPAKLAYDIAKRDIEIKELMNLKSSDDWKQFQEWKKNKVVNKQIDLQPNKQKSANVVASKVPNLNRQTNVSKTVNKSEEDDDLFAGAAF